MKKVLSNISLGTAVFTLNCGMSQAIGVDRNGKSTNGSIDLEKTENKQSVNPLLDFSSQLKEIQEEASNILDDIEYNFYEFSTESFNRRINNVFAKKGHLLRDCVKKYGFDSCLTLIDVVRDLVLGQLGKKVDTENQLGMLLKGEILRKFVLAFL